VGAGTNDTTPRAASRDDLIIAADGGVDFLTECGITPDFVIGDFDSVAAPPLANSHTISLPTQKDDTDMTSAVKLGWEKGYRHFHIYGGLGGRLDHTLANIQLLAAIAEHGGIGFLYSRDSIVTALAHSRLTFSAPAAQPGNHTEKEMVSVFAHTDTADAVTIDGFKYEVRGAQLRNTTPLGVSNEFVSGEVAPHPSIAVGDGILTVTFPATARVAAVEFHNEEAPSFGELTTSVSSLLAHD
jgi:thiamine pyrophosphokinase